MTKFATFIFLLFVAGCTLPVEHPDFKGLPPDTRPETFTCCQDPARHDTMFADLALFVSEPLSPMFLAEEGSGRLARHPESVDRIARRARPFDMLVFSSKTQTSSRMLPGWFTHSAIYIGTEAELRDAGFWSHPAVVPHRDAIRAGHVLVEGVAPEVMLSRLDTVLGKKDAVALVRPASLKRAEKSDVLTRAMGFVGRPFDYSYDLQSCDRLACSEVLARAYPTIEFPVRQAERMLVLLPDDIAAKAIRREELAFIDYIEATDDGYSARGQTGAMERIAAFWGPAPVAPVARVCSSRALPVCEAAN